MSEKGTNRASWQGMVRDGVNRTSRPQLAREPDKIFHAERAVVFFRALGHPGTLFAVTRHSPVARRGAG